MDIKIFITISEDAHLQELALSGNDILSIPFGGPLSTNLNAAVSAGSSNTTSLRWFPQVERVLSLWMHESASTLVFWILLCSAT